MSQYAKYPNNTGGGGGSGTVTSVGLSSPGVVYTVSGSPVTTSGTLTLNLINQNANTVLAGPTTGAAAAPSFRSLVAADIPALPYVTSTLPSADIFVGNVSNVATAVALSGDGTLSNTGALTVSSISGAVATSNATPNTIAKRDANASFGMGPLAIGQNAPTANTIIDTVSDLSAASQAVVLTGYGINQISFRSRRARGTSSSPTAAQTGDILASYGGLGYGATTFGALNDGMVRVVASENFTDTSHGTYLTINSTPVTTTGVVENARFASTGSTIGPQSASTAIHQINGGINGTVRTSSSNVTVDTTTTDYIIFADTSGGAFTVTLPTPTAGRILFIKDSTGSFNTNNLTVARHAAEKIEGLAASKLLTTNWGSYQFTSNGTDWFLV